MQPTADSFHLGDYVGALRHWVALPAGAALAHAVVAWAVLAWVVLVVVL